MTILDEAGKLVDGERENTYGHPADDFRKVTLAAAALGVDPVAEGTLHHALYMILVKIQRLVQTPDHHDSIVDIAGYARTYEKILERNNKREIREVSDLAHLGAEWHWDDNFNSWVKEDNGTIYFYRGWDK